MNLFSNDTRGQTKENSRFNSIVTCNASTPNKSTKVSRKLCSVIGSGVGSHSQEDVRNALSWVNEKQHLREKSVRKNRKIVNQYLTKITNHLGSKGDLSLNSEGKCYIPHKRFVFVIDVPKDNYGKLCNLYTMVCKLRRGDNFVEVLKTAMTLNYMQNRSRGATIGMDGNEISLFFSIPISSLKGFDDLMNCITDFMNTAFEINRELELAKQVGGHVRERTTTC